MRKLPILLVLLSLSLLLLAAAASAHAASLPLPAQAAPLFVEVDDDEGDDAGDDEGGEGGEAEELDNEGEDQEAEVADADDEGEDCGPDEDELCVEALAAEEAEECVLKTATASFVAAPDAGQLRLTVHYRASEPTAVAVDARLRGAKGALHLGADRVRFHRAGVYREVFSLGSKQMAKAVAAKDLEVELRAVGTPAECGMHLSIRGPRRAR